MRQSVIGSQDERFSIADYNVQPMEHPILWIIGFVLVFIFLQGRDITTVPIAMNCATLFNCRVSKLFHRCLFDIFRNTHLEILRVAVFIQRQCHKNLCFFCSATTFTACFRSTKVGIIKLYYPGQKVCLVSLSHCRANAPQHGPGGFVGHADLSGQLRRGNSSFILGDQIKSKKPLAEANMASMQNSAGGN